MGEQYQGTPRPNSAQERHAALLQYAWGYFSYHAEQRASMFNYSLVAATLLAAGLATALADGMWAVAAAIGIVGAIVAVSFWRMDERNSTLVKHSEQVLAALEKELFSGDRSVLVGIVRKDNAAYPDRVRLRPTLAEIRTQKSLAPLARWCTDWPRDWWRGKHAVHLRLIELSICLLFLAGAVAAISFREAVTSEASRTEREQRVAVQRGIDAIAANLSAVTEKLATLEVRVKSPSGRALQSIPDTPAPPPRKPARRDGR